MPRPLIPARLPGGRELQLTARGRDTLLKKIVDDLCPRFTPGGVILYVDDTGDGRRHLEGDYLERLGLGAAAPGRMPGMVIHLQDENWLVLIEAATHHGPIDDRRRGTLKDAFKRAKPALVFVTAFPTRRAMTRHFEDIAWGTEVWIAEAPAHLIHFDGECLFGPYARHG